MVNSLEVEITSLMIILPNQTLKNEIIDSRTTFSFGNLTVIEARLSSF
jgi:hypothetical protein